MNIIEFLKAHDLNCRTPEEEEFMLQALDKMYLELPAEKAVKLVQDYMDNADDIYNETFAQRVAQGKEKIFLGTEEK